MQLLLNHLPNFHDGNPERFVMLRRINSQRRKDFDVEAGGNVEELKRWREIYLTEHKEYMLKLQEKSRAQEEARRAHGVNLQITAGMSRSPFENNLCVRCARKPPNRFPTLPRDVANIRFDDLRKRYRNLSRLKSKKKSQDKDVQAIESEMAEVLLEARQLANAEIEKESSRLELHQYFPRVRPQHPHFNKVAILKTIYHRLKDPSRKYPQREQAAVILRQAWDLITPRIGF